MRLEHGRDDPDAYYEDWYDFNGLLREVLNPLSHNGTGLLLPALWDAERDRSPRLDRIHLAEGGVALVDGPFLLGAGLSFDLTVHLWLSQAALQRRLGEAWKLRATASAGARRFT